MENARSPVASSTRRSRFSSSSRDIDKKDDEYDGENGHETVERVATTEVALHPENVAQQKAAELNARISAVLESAPDASAAEGQIGRKRSRFSKVSSTERSPPVVKKSKFALSGLQQLPGSALPSLPSSSLAPHASAPKTMGPTQSEVVFSVHDTERDFDSIRKLESIPISSVATLKVNQMRERERKLNKLLKIGASAHDDDNESNPFFDTELRGTRARNRELGKRVEIQEPGIYAMQGDELREQHRVQVLYENARQDTLERAKYYPPLALLKDPIYVKPPSVEWWDVDFVRDAECFLRDSFDSDADVLVDQISSLVHHPVPVEYCDPSAEQTVIPFMLTKAETKRMRRMRRLAAEQARQDEIQMGLAEPPKPKVKLSNLMRVLAVQQAQDPTKVEAQVRRDIEERQRRHFATNEARKPTKEEVWRRTNEKMERDREAGLHMAVFRVLGEMGVKNKTKMVLNAKDMHVTGVCFAGPDWSMVIAECGAKGLRKFSQMMMHRMSWADTDLDAKTSAEAGEALMPRKACTLVWQGGVLKSTFDDFRTFSQPPDHARSFFRRHELLHLWESCMNIA